MRKHNQIKSNQSPTHILESPTPHPTPPNHHTLNPQQCIHDPIANDPPSPPTQVQTPQQRRANEAFAKSEAAKRGKPQTEVERLAEKKKAAKLQQKSPVSKVWLCESIAPLNLYYSLVTPESACV